MKSIRLFFTLTFILASASFTLAQTTTETFSVAGNCGMCKSRIEKAAKEAGATEASWDQNKKALTVSFNADASSMAKIQQKVAEVGHDNVGFRATDEVYAKLHGCCKYERANSTEAAAGSCCKEGQCGKDGKCKEGKSGKGSNSCKEGGASCGNTKGNKGESCCSKKS